MSFFSSCGLDACSAHEYSHVVFMKRKDSQETVKTLLTRLDLDLADAFTALAASRHRSVAAELRRMIEVEVDHADATAQRQRAA